MQIISFGEIDKKLLIPILAGITSLIFRYTSNSNPKNEALNNNPFIKSIFTALGMNFSFIPYLILKIRSKKKNKNPENNIILNKIQKTKLSIKFEYYDIYEIKRWHKYKIIIISAILDFAVTFLLLFFCNECIYNLWVLLLIFISIFSHFILKTNLYKHQYFSMIIIIILGFGLNVIEYFKSDKKEKIKYFEILAKFIVEIMISLFSVLNKYNMEKYFCTSYEICIWEGLIEIILFTICLCIINKIGITISDIKHPDNFFEYKDNFNKNDLILIFMLIIASFFYNLFYTMTSDYFTPYHTLIAKIISESYLYFNIGENKALNIIGFIILIFIFFLFLFFIEVLEFNLYGFSKYTKRNIGKRATIDSDNNIGVNDSILDESQIENENGEDEGRNTVQSVSLIDIKKNSTEN